MKKFILSIIVLSSCFCKAQDANADIDKRIDAKLNPAILSSGTTIAQSVKTAIAALGPFESDTVITATSKTATSFNIDTLYIPNNTSVIFTIDLQNENIANKDLGKAGKKVMVSNVNGVYKLYWLADLPLYSADPTLTKASWSVWQSGKFIAIQCTGITGITISWQVTVRQNPPQNL